MDAFLRCAALALTGVILSLVLGRRTPDLGVLLTLAVCVLLGLTALRLLDPVVELLRQLRRLGCLDGDALSILLKTAGIAVISELAALICSDAGEGALGKALQLLANAAILWLSLPLFQQILTMLEGVLTQN